MRRIVLLAVGVLGVVAAIAATAGAQTTPLAAGESRDGAAANPLSAEGTWTAYKPLAGGDARTALRATAPELVVPQKLGCPPGTSNYPGTLARYNCLATYRDNGNEGPDPSIGLRRGDATLEPGFGLDKILFKHGINQRTLGYVVVNNREGIPQENGNEKYGLYFAVNGIPQVAVEVIVQQAPDHADVAPDTYNLGIVTAYCVGFDGLCPPGLNESVAPGQP